jgi:hypothetical protein
MHAADRARKAKAPGPVLRIHVDDNVHDIVDVSSSANALT